MTIMTTQYPEKLTIDDFAKKINGVIYTQVDGDTEIEYIKGLHFINRTGLYEVVKLD